MKKTLLMSSGLMISLLQPAAAQVRSISGRVFDRTNGEALPGATVLVKGTSAGVSTNSDGTFALDVPAGGTTLVITSVGYLPIEQALGKQQRLDIGLAPDTKTLNEVVVVGYGEQSKTLITTAVSTIDNKQFQGQPATGVDQILQGRASGVQVTSSSGTPGGGVSVRIRGNNSITAGSQPLYVVDGTPVLSGSYSDIGVGGQGLNALSDINPNDIASIEILKDASAAAIYGSRGSNGVVLITTKRGQAGRTKLNFDMYVGTQEVIKKREALPGPELVALIGEAYNNTGQAPPAGLPTDVNTNWQDEIFRKAPISNYTLTMSGGDAKTKILATASYFDQKGIVIGSGYKRGSGRLNIDYNVSDKVKTGFNVGLSRSLSNRIYNDNNIYGVVSGSVLLGSYVPVRNADGTWGKDETGLTPVANPVQQATEAIFDSRSTRLVGNAFVEYEPIRDLLIRSNFGTDYINLKEDQFEPSTLPQASASRGAGTSNSRSEVLWLNETTARYNRTFANDHNLSLLLGAGVQSNYQEGQQTSTTNFPGNDIRTVGAGAVNVGAASDITEWALVSGFARFNYDYKGKYIFQASTRRDGSSRFGRNQQYGWFPAASVAWRVGQENFLSGFTALSELKLRAGYGRTGNLNIGNFASRGLWSPSYYGNYAGLAPSQFGNDDLTWEKSGEYNVGVDYGFFDNRIIGSVNGFSRKSIDLLLNRQVPSSSGYSTRAENSGEVTSKGLEFDLTTENFRGSNGAFSWTTNLNLSFIRNEITQLATNNQLQGFGSILKVGQPLGAFYGYRVDRIYQNVEEIKADDQAARDKAGKPNDGSIFYQLSSAIPGKGTSPGDIRFKDLNGDGRITSADQEVIGSAQPKFFGGMTNTLSWKGIDLSFFLQFTYGNDMYNSTKDFGESMSTVYGQFATVRDRWKSEAQPGNGKIPRAAAGDPNSNRRDSDRYLEDGSYARLKTATLGYNLPSQLVNKAHLQSARIYVAGQNLLTFTNYSGLDPEVSTFNTTNTALGTDFLTFPQARTYQLGVNLGF
ncbi:TonB-dependent receptor [Hymenobacter busanensis]|uniref:TonB-dependent receptor n=1 Tax=Hymenobacter busanensis TaxID=2607656 RepID=A0A7L5A2K9_9BACT|nr:TonB-dependent receptor [Hymenobacter busanensis]KAA9338311.1 TonB-dependent receptor [Hymenobacter busanensis]QHJ09265.1 SusC/RagA family TonB-linked outer membrane protein [Hymenobacter busanensis]